METATPSPTKPESEVRAAIELTVRHLSGMLRTHRRLIDPTGAAAAVSTALERHLRALTPADLGLPEVWPSADAAAHADRITALARAEARDLAAAPSPAALSA